MTLNNAHNLRDLQSGYFVRMMLPDAEKKAGPYVREEQKALLGLVRSENNSSRRNFVVIGSGTMWYIEIALKAAKKYIAIEPLANIFISKQMRFLLKERGDIEIIESEFGDFSNKVFDGYNSIFVFHFNIISYILDPIKKINKYLKKGDILYISTWSNTTKSQQARKRYFDYLNDGTTDSFKVDPTGTNGLCDLDSFTFTELKFYERHERTTGDITDVLIIYT